MAEKGAGGSSWSRAGCALRLFLGVLSMLSAEHLAATAYLPDPDAEAYERALTAGGSLSVAKDSEITSDVHANGAVALSSGVLIDGDLSATGNIALHGATVTGTVTPFAPAQPLPFLPSATEARTLADRIFEGNRSFPSGTVIDDVVFVAGQARFLGSINGTGTVIAGAQVRFDNVSPGQPAELEPGTRMSFVSLGSLWVGKDRKLRGELVAGGAAQLHKGLDLDGLVAVRGSLAVHKDSVITYSPPVGEGEDVTPPVITPLTPTPGGFAPSSRPSVVASFSDDGAGVDSTSVQLVIDGVEVTSGAAVSTEGIAWPADPALADGAHVVELAVADLVGNPATASWLFTVDTTSPSVAIVEPSEDVVTSPTPSIAITYADDLTGVDLATVEVTVDEMDLTGSCTLGPTLATCTAPPLEQGRHNVGAQIRDLAGHAQVASRAFDLVLDTAAPVVNIAAPEDGAIVNTPTIEVSGTVTDESEVVSVTVDGVVATVVGDSFTAEVTLDAEVQTIRVLAEDAFSQQGNASVIVIRDQAAPVINVESPESPALVNADTVRVRGTMDDDYGVAEARVAGEVVSLEDGAFDEQVPLVPGANSIPVVATDIAGNSTSDSLDVEYFTLPEASITSPADLSTIEATTVEVSGTVGDPSAAVTVNGVVADVSGTGFTAAGVALIEGGNTLTATVTDASGHVATDSVTVLRDTRPPIAEVYSPRDGAVVFTDSVTVRGLINDIVAGTVNASEATVTVNGLEAMVENRSFLAEAVPLALGVNTLTLRATDASGNSSIRTHAVERRAPVVERIEAVSGGGQSGTIGALLPQSLIARVVDAAGLGVPGVPVVFSVEDSDGIVQPVGGGAPGRKVAVFTDATGEAAVLHTLGLRAGVGNQVVVARAAGYAGRAEFSASAVAGEPALVVVDANGLQVGVAGRELPRPWVAAVVDAGSNRLLGVPVLWRVLRGDGRFLNDQSEIVVDTDSDGRAIVPFILGPELGIANHVVEASIDGLAGSPAAGFTASAVPAGDPASTTISGVVLDNTDLPVAGVTLRIRGSAITAVTDNEGQFRITGAPVGDVDLIVDGSTADRPGSWPDLEFDLVTIPGRDNTVNTPIRLLPLELANGVQVSETQGGTVTLEEIPGFALEIAPGSVTFPGGGRSGMVSVTVVHSDKVPMTPNFGQAPRLIVTIQPAGALFDPPAPLTLPNVEGLAPGAVTEMYSFDHDLGHFVSIGPATVSEDGTVIRSDPGVGILKAGWHCGGNPTGTGTPHDCPECQACEGRTCVADDGQTPEQVQGNCSQEVCRGGAVARVDDDSDRPPDRDPQDCLRVDCLNGRPLWVTDTDEVPEQIPGNCYREICPIPAHEPDPGDAPPGLQCCIDEDPVFDDVAPFNPDTQCCTPTGVKPIHPISLLDLRFGLCPEMRTREGFDWPVDPPYDECTVPEQVYPALETIPFYSGDHNNPAGFEDTSFSQGTDSPCFVHDACYFTCVPDYFGFTPCNVEFALNLLQVCSSAELDHQPLCFLFADLYATAVGSAGPFVYPMSQQNACQCC